MKCNEENDDDDDVMLEVVAQPPYRPTELFFQDSLVVNPDPSPPSLHFAVLLPSLSEVLPAHPCWAQDSANVNRIKRDGITKLVVLPLYPQFSISTSGSSLRLLESIFREDEYLVNMQHTVIPSWYQREGYIKAMADLMEKELKSFERPKEVMLFFSAHGVPLAYVEEAGDPYKAEMEECVDLIMEELEKRRVHNAYTLAYQSRVGPVEWLKPYTDETIIELGMKGVKSILAVPISFVSEHIETLEEIDVEYKELALESGIQNWARVPALGVEPTFISDLADAVIESLPYVGAMAVSNLEARQVLFNSRAVIKKFLKFLLRVDGANDPKYLKHVNI
ncbi:Ferrochelatase-2, chloroplastic [Capsicum chinense]|nr:Ferrochelatase-2, chloroplastic [Capsicum chinense]